MATPMTADQLVAQLRKWRIPYREVRGWRTHNRNVIGAWGPVNGFIWHHTGVAIAADNGHTYAAGTLFHGRSDLPGPLCQLSVGLDGMVYLVGWGRANHAGGGDPATLAHVVNEDYTGRLRPTKGDRNGMDGNARFYGMEIQYSGSRPMSSAQYRTALLVSAAILDHHDWTAKSVIAHGEWSNDKWDPGYAKNAIMNMVDVRNDVAATLDAGPGAVGRNADDDMPQYVNLGIAKPFTLAPGQDWDAIEFTTEWTDEPGHHALDGSVFARGPARFTGQVSLVLEGVLVGAQVQVRQSEVDSTGRTYVADHPVHEVIGADGDTYAVVPVTGRIGIGRQMRIRVKAFQDTPVTVTSAGLKALVWKES